MYIYINMFLRSLCEQPKTGPAIYFRGRAEHGKRVGLHCTVDVRLMHGGCTVDILYVLCMYIYIYIYIYI